MSGSSSQFLEDAPGRGTTFHHLPESLGPAAMHAVIAMVVRPDPVPCHMQRFPRQDAETEPQNDIQVEPANRDKVLRGEVVKGMPLNRRDGQHRSVAQPLADVGESKCVRRLPEQTVVHLAVERIEERVAACTVRCATESASAFGRAFSDHQDDVGVVGGRNLTDDAAHPSRLGHVVHEQTYAERWTDWRKAQALIRSVRLLRPRRNRPGRGAQNRQSVPVFFGVEAERIHLTSIGGIQKAELGTEENVAQLAQCWKQRSRFESRISIISIGRLSRKIELAPVRTEYSKPSTSIFTKSGSHPRQQQSHPEFSSEPGFQKSVHFRRMTVPHSSRWYRPSRRNCSGR